MPHRDSISKKKIHRQKSHNDKRRLRPIKKISVFLATGLKILGRVGTHIFFHYFLFSRKKYIIVSILKGEMPLKMHKIIFFPENMKKS